MAISATLALATALTARAGPQTAAAHQVGARAWAQRRAQGGAGHRGAVLRRRVVRGGRGARARLLTVHRHPATLLHATPPPWPPLN